MPGASKPAKENPLEDDAWVEEISQKTVIKVLLKKGVVTARELLDAEKQNRAHPSHKSFQSSHRPNSWIKRFAAHYRWSRRLTHLLFGWDWKRVKASPEELESS